MECKNHGVGVMVIWDEELFKRCPVCEERQGLIEKIIQIGEHVKKAQDAFDEYIEDMRAMFDKEILKKRE